jgi:hypothetical protein
MNLKMPVLITNRLRILRFMGAMREINQGGLILLGAPASLPATCPVLPAF